MGWYLMAAVVGLGLGAVIIWLHELLREMPEDYRHDKQRPRSK